MRALIVLAHPESKSYNAALALVARDTLQQQGYEVRLADLYRQSFAADEHARHFVYRANACRFDAQAEQRFNADRNTLPLDVHRNSEDLLWADLVVLQFPLWWFGMPAILKGWMDRVFVYGKLYSSDRRLDCGICAGKRAMLSVTAGSSKDACAPDGQEGDTRLILWPIHYALYYVGFSVLEPTIATGVRPARSSFGTQQQLTHLRQQLRDHRAIFQKIDARRAIAFNQSTDWDSDGKLKPGAPVYSPFIRHANPVE